MFGALYKEVGGILGSVCKMEEVTIIKTPILSDHIHMYGSISLKKNVSKFIGEIRVKSALILFDRHQDSRKKYNRHFDIRRYYCETVGNVNEETIKRYIAEQYERNRMECYSGKVSHKEPHLSDYQ